jgi:Icc-related predicted phosphoesterase
LKRLDKIKTLFVGDIHGSYRDLSVFDIEGDYTRIQVGDFNLEGYKMWRQYGKRIRDGFTLKEHNFKYPTFFIDGNHEAFNHPLIQTNSNKVQKIEENLFYIPRGFVSGSVLFIGGENSIDKQNRKEGIDWFPEEEITEEQYNRIMGIEQRIDVIVSHGAPITFLNQIFKRSYKMKHDLLLNDIFMKHRPSLYVFGHHHFSVKKSFRDCFFVGLNVAEAVEINVPLGNELQSSIY